MDIAFTKYDKNIVFDRLFYMGASEAIYWVVGRARPAPNVIMLNNYYVLYVLTMN